MWLGTSGGVKGPNPYEKIPTAAIHLLGNVCPTIPIHPHPRLHDEGLQVYGPG
jgi:hypothetical protein